MKVLFVCSGNKSNNNPGVVVHNQAKTLIKKGINIEYYLINKRGLWGYINAIKPLIQKLNNEQYHAIHAHYSLSGYVAGLARYFAGNKPPLIVSLMGSDTEGKIIKLKIIQTFSNLFWSQTIVKSKAMSKSLRLRNLNVIPNGINLEEIKAAASSEKRNNNVLFPADPKRVSKNFPLAKKSFDDLANPTLKLEVLFNRPHEDIIHNLKTCACVLMTSRWEGSPNVIKEAMACNTPIVATCVGDVENLLKNVDGCFLTDDNPKSISTAIRKATSYAKESIHTNGRQKLKELKLASDSIADKIIKLYEQPK
jgi:glycosyltransferase involved in cell wall biosynthesis